MGHAWGIRNQLAGTVREVSEAFGRFNITVDLSSGQQIVVTEEVPYGDQRPSWQAGDLVTVEFFSTDAVMKKQ